MDSFCNVFVLSENFDCYIADDKYNPGCSNKIKRTICLFLFFTMKSFSPNYLVN